MGEFPYDSQFTAKRGSDAAPFHEVEWSMINLKLFFSGILAQLGEHLPYKQRVTGSSPVGPI